LRSLLELGRKSVVVGTEFPPLFGDDLRLITSDVVLRGFTHDDGETDFQMPINVAMEDPWAWVVCEEADSSVATVDSHDITLDGILEVPDVRVGRLDDIERVAVEMERVSTRTGDVNFDGLVARENEQVFRGNEVLWLSSTGQDLEEGRDGRRNPGDAVDFPEGWMGLGDVEDDVDVGGAVTSWKTGMEGSVEVLLQERVGDVGRSSHRGLNLGGTLVAEDGKSERVVEIRITARGASTSTTSTWGTDPIVRNGLVGSNDDRVPLCDEDIELIDNEGIALDTISFDNGHVVTVDREAIEGTASDVGDTETVALSVLDIDDGEWHLGTTLVATNTVDEDGIRDRDDGCLVVHLLQQRSLLVVIVGKGDDSA